MMLSVYSLGVCFFFSSRRRHTRCALVTGVQTCALPISYQVRAIRAMAESLAQGRRAGLLTMATGTGKTRVSIALVDLLLRAHWVKRVLFLADRVALVRQAANFFKAHMPDQRPVNPGIATDGD